MTLDPALAAFVRDIGPMLAIDWAKTPAPELRAMLDQPLALGPPIAMARVEHLQIPLAGRTLEARLYAPEAAGADAPLVVYFHGGGFVHGTLDTHDATCRALARESAAGVLSVAYRLAPEHPYPAAAEDAHGAAAWAFANARSLGFDAGRLAVAGDSAGGNLAAAASILARERGGPPLRLQALIYPTTDAEAAHPSLRAFGGGDYFLSTAMMKRYWSDYLGARSAREAPLAAVLRRDDLAGLAPALVVTAEYDPLKDEGAAYAANLKAAGVAVDAWDAPGMVHGFVSLFEISPAALGFVRRLGADIRRRLAP